MMFSLISESVVFLHKSVDERFSMRIVLFVSLVKY